MRDSFNPSFLTSILGLIAVFATLVVGVTLRLIDPLSSPVIPAEDPYTHMALIREHIRSGTLSPLESNGALYPPGMHAFLAAVWAFTGMSLAEIIRFGPVVFGAIGIIGMALLLWRNLGPVAGFVGALAYAVTPEIVFRTTMMAPTAMDLALLPFLLLAMVEVLKGRLPWLLLLAPMALFFVFAHPWIFGILSITVFVLVLLSLFARWPTDRAPNPSALGATLVFGVIGVGLATTMTTCGGYCGPGLINFMPDFVSAAWAVPLVAIGSMLPAAIVTWNPPLVQRLLTRDRRLMKPAVRITIQSVLSIGLLVALYAITGPALAQGLPEQVELVRMIGWPVLVLGILPLVALPFLRGPMAYLGAGVFLATFPMVIYNVFDSPFWSHRTVVFLALGLTILVGVSAKAITQWGIAAILSLRQVIPWRRGQPMRGSLVAVAALIVALSLGGTVYDATPGPYEGGWYRMYPECEMDAIESIGAELNGDPTAVVITGDWQPRLALASFTSNPDRVWFDPAFFHSEERRKDVYAQQDSKGEALYVMIDRHTEQEVADHDRAFLHDDPWVQSGSYCAGQGVERARLAYYEYQGLRT